MPTLKTLALSAIVIASLHLACSATLFAQLADVPIKPGLWATQVTVNGRPPVSAQSCFTKDTRLSEYMTASNRGGTDTKCNVTNKSESGSTISFDTACTSAQFTSQGHLTIQIVDTEHVTGKSHTTVAGSSQGHSINMAVDRTFDGKFISADCGSVKPMVPQPGK